MGLKNKNSIFDLVAGNNPVESMASQTGPISQLPTEVASQVHVDSLQVVPGGVQNSPFQDLNGVPDPNFNTLNGVSDSPFQGQTGDHMIDLLTQQITSTNTNQVYNPAPNTSPFQDLNGQQGPQFQLPTDAASQVHIDSLQVVPGGTQNSPFQDLDGVPDPNFNTLSGISDSPFQGQTGDHMVDLLTQIVTSTNTSQVYNPAPNTSQYQDLNGSPGPNFDFGENSTLQDSSLINAYQSSVNPGATYGAGQPGGTWPVVNSANLDLDGAPGPSFDQGPEDSPNIIDRISEIGLEGIYNSAVNPLASYGAGQPGGTWPALNPSLLDKNGNPGIPFDNGPEASPNVIDTIAETSLESIYQSGINQGASYGAGQPNGIWPSVNPSILDLDGNPGPSFNNGISSTLKVDLLANVYQSGINPGASYGAGQPGGIWPAVNPSPLASTPFADLDGITPSQYLNNLPN